MAEKAISDCIYKRHLDTSTTLLMMNSFSEDNTDAEAVYADADTYSSSIKRDLATASSLAGWPVIQAFDFAVDGDVTISYSKGGNPQSITLKFLNDPDDYASLSLDRSSYPAGADVHMTITSLAHNIDPTDEDSWTYNTESGDAVYYVFDENGGSGANSGNGISP